MDLEEKEIELIESSLEKTRVSMKKYDSASASLMIAAIILFLTSEPEATIKLVFLGVELKSIYAIYMLFIFSIVLACSYATVFAKKTLLFHRYKYLIKKRFGDVPKSFFIIDSDDYKIRKVLFDGRLNVINAILIFLIYIPFFLSYFYMAYHLVMFSSAHTFESISSFLIIVFGIYFIALFSRALYVEYILNK